MYRLKELRQLNGKTQGQVAAWLSITQAAYSKYECGRAEPSLESLSILCEKYNVSLDYLMGKNDEKIKNPPNVFDVDGIVCFEEIGTICAGFNGSLNETLTGEIVDIPLSMISGGHKEEYFVLRVQGNSMHPRILEGDRILCKRCSSVDSGSFAVVLYDGECATVKKVNYVNGENWLELIPINPEYETKRISGADLEQCRILGKVVKLIRDL